MGAPGKPRDPGSGRKKGTPNKSVRSLEEIAEKCGVNPFEFFCKVINNDWEALGYEEANFVVAFTEKGDAIEKERISMELRLTAAKEAAKYLYPQRKAIEHSGEINNPYMAMSVEELEKLVKEKIK